ncbi:RNase P subunit p30-domain-containing protein [Cunninghamella echinulata]|nr:RNase P subunit p30-domain-containing protein [Cunninghamella echinulata]
MFIDLNIPVPAHLDRKEREKLILILYQLSHSDDQVIVALNHTIDKYPIKQLPKIEAPITFDNLKILTRITIETDTPIEESHLEELQSIYDLVSIRTSNRQVFEQASQSNHIDIISLSCVERISFDLNPIYVQKAIENHIYFELCYSPGIRDNTFRGYVFQVGSILVSLTKGDHLIISSEAENVSEVRSPYDVYYFAKSFGLPNDIAKFTYCKNSYSLLTHKSL